MKIHLDLDCYFVSAERTRHQFLKGKNVVVVKGSDNRIFSNSKKDGVILGNTGAFNSVLEFSVGTQRIWPARAFTLGQLTHDDLASVRIAKRATKSL